MQFSVLLSGALCCCVAISQPATPLLVRPTRHDIIDQARVHLQGSQVTSRMPRRAASTSSFGRFLTHHPHPYISDVFDSAGLGSSRSEGGSPSVNVFDFGADPTCGEDSSEAFDAAVQAALAHDNGRGMGAGGKIRDLGGVTINLQGGDYLISRPISIPEFFGNFRIVGGTLRAGPTFPVDRYLIEIGGDPAACKQDNRQHSCNERIGIEDLFFDGDLRAKGGVQINSTMGGNLGPDLFFIHFDQAGLTVNGGHEVMLHEAWFGRVYYDAKNKTSNLGSSVAIELNGNDHIVSDVIIFAAQTGVTVNGGANLVEGVHCWNDGSLNGGHGIVVTASSTRLDGCYLDYTDLVLEDPFHVSVSNGFFLGMATVVLRAGSRATVEGLSLMANSWHNANMPHNDTVVLDERGKTFKSVKDLVMLGNVADHDKFTTRAVTVTKSLMKSAAKRWAFDFADSFVFPSIPISSVTYSISIAGSGFARHAARPAVNHTVMVETDEPVDATVTVTASQSVFSVGNGMLQEFSLV